MGILNKLGFQPTPEQILNKHVRRLGYKLDIAWNPEVLKWEMHIHDLNLKLASDSRRAVVEEGIRRLEEIPK